MLSALLLAGLFAAAAYLAFMLWWTFASDLGLAE
jgi:hypothetical protein